MAPSLFDCHQGRRARIVIGRAAPAGPIVPRSAKFVPSRSIRPLAVVAVPAAIVVLLVFLYSAVPQLTARALLNRLSELNGAEVEAANFDWSLADGRFEITGLAIANPIQPGRDACVLSVFMAASVPVHSCVVDSISSTSYSTASEPTSPVVARPGCSTANRPSETNAHITRRPIRSSAP